MMPEGQCQRGLEGFAARKRLHRSHILVCRFPMTISIWVRTYR